MPTRRTYTIGNNTLSVLEAGRKGNPVALFLHGIPASAELWRDVMKEIAGQGWFCLAPDLPGYGGTFVEEPSYYTLEGTAQFLIKWLEEERLSDIWLVGHDIGGGVAQLMVTEKETLFQKLTLSNCITSDSWPVPAVRQMIMASRLGIFYRLARINFMSFRKLYRAVSASFYNSSLSESDLRRIFYDGKFHDKKMILNFQKMLKRLSNQFTQRNMKALAEVDVPVHLVWGMEDSFQPWAKAGKTLEKTFKNVRVTQLDSCGHYLQLDAFEDYVRVILT